MKEKEPEACQAFIIAVKRLRRRKHARLPRGYKKDPKKYKETTLNGN